MEIAVFSDIHANHEAFHTCFEYCTARGIDQYFFLGDYLGEHAYPEKTMSLIYEIRDQYRTEFIRGNKEDYWLRRWKTGKGFPNGDWKKTDSTTGALYYTYERITEKDLKFFDEMPITKVIHTPGLPDIQLMHGSYRSNRDHLYNNPMTHWMLDFEIEPNFVLCGHTHIQEQYQYKSKLVTNTGSIGVSFGAGGDAQFAILGSEGSTWNVLTMTLPYRKEITLNALDEGGLSDRAPAWTRVTKHLATVGTKMHVHVMMQAIRIGREKYGYCEWPQIPEDCWEQACYEMDINS